MCYQKIKYDGGTNNRNIVNIQRMCDTDGQCSSDVNDPDCSTASGGGPVRCVDCTDATCRSNVTTATTTATATTQGIYY